MSFLLSKKEAWWLVGALVVFGVSVWLKEWLEWRRYVKRERHGLEAWWHSKRAQEGRERS